MYHLHWESSFFKIIGVLINGRHGDGTVEVTIGDESSVSSDGHSRLRYRARMGILNVPLRSESIHVMTYVNADLSSRTLLFPVPFSERGISRIRLEFT